MKSLYDTNLPFENFADQIEELIIIGDAAGILYSARQIVTAAYNVLQSTGVFEDECKMWHKNAPDLCKWATMKNILAVHTGT